MIVWPKQSVVDAKLVEPGSLVSIRKGKDVFTGIAFKRVKENDINLVCFSENGKSASSLNRMAPISGSNALVADISWRVEIDALLSGSGLILSVEEARNGDLVVFKGGECGLMISKVVSYSETWTIASLSSFEIGQVDFDSTDTEKHMFVRDWKMVAIHVSDASPILLFENNPAEPSK